MGSHQDIILSKSNPYGQQESKPLEGIMGNNYTQGFIGVLEVYVHQARDIHNICIYHKQDVYAKIFLTSDPDSTESTRTINGGGQNPVFNENLRINVRAGDGSLRCEIWMLSRVRNYLEDQLLGFALVPLCDVLIENQELEREFELWTSDLFHSLAGFVKLSFRYTGICPDVVEIPTVSRCLCDQELEENDGVSCELEKIEFPDPNVLNENEVMVTEYYSKCAEIESQSTQNDDCVGSSSNNHLVSRFSEENLETPPMVSRFPEGNLETPPVVLRFPEQNLETCLEGNLATPPVVSRFPEENLETPLMVSRFPKQNLETPPTFSRFPKENLENPPALSRFPKETLENPPTFSRFPRENLENPPTVSRFPKENLETPPTHDSKPSEDQKDTVQSTINRAKVEPPEQKMVQQEIVDMYMKSMKQFTEALAKMKLPMDKGNTSPDSGATNSAESNGKGSKPEGPSPKVFYGSRAFF